MKPQPTENRNPENFFPPVIHKASKSLTQGLNNIADTVQSASVGYATGATLGNFDEMMGGTTAALTGNQSNYKIGRDAVRHLQNNLNQRHPYVYGGMEFVGAMQSPMHLFKDTSKVNKILNAATDTVNASAGYAENWKDFGVNLIANGIANTIGLGFERIPEFRAIGPQTGKLLKSSRKFIKQGINSLADKTKNRFYNKDK